MFFLEYESISDLSADIVVLPLKKYRPGLPITCICVGNVVSLLSGLDKYRRYNALFLKRPWSSKTSFGSFSTLLPGSYTVLAIALMEYYEIVKQLTKHATQTYKRTKLCLRGYYREIPNSICCDAGNLKPTWAD